MGLLTSMMIANGVLFTAAAGRAIYIKFKHAKEQNA